VPRLPESSHAAIVVAAETLPVDIGPGSTPADRDPRLVYLASLSSEKGRRSMRSALSAVATMLGTTADAVPWHLLRYQHTQAIRARLVERYAPATANKTLAALRGVLREAARLGLMSAEDSQRARDVRPARGSRLLKGRALSRAELLALIGACDAATAAGARDAAMVAILYGCGLRRAELVTLDRTDFDGAALRVRGKGGKERRAQVAMAASYLTAWLAVRGDAVGPLFLPVDRYDHPRWKRLADAAVRHILQRIAARAGVADFTPHDMRRSFVSDLLEAGADVATVQRMAGHASIVTTQKYDRRGEDAQKRAAGLLKL
jgi:site-specific recombinase XerD